METSTFTALCERAGRWWAIRIPQVQGLTVQVRSLDQAETVARQSIARALGIPADTIAVEVVPDAPAPVAYALQVRHAARQAAEVAAKATWDALDVLTREGYLFHDAATLLGLSPAEVKHYGAGRDATAGHPRTDDGGPLLTAGT